MQFTLPLQEDGVSQRHSTTLHIMLAFLLFGIGAASIGLFWFTTVSPAFEKQGGGYKPFIFFGVASLLGSMSIILLSVFQKKRMRAEGTSLVFRIIELALLAAASVLFFVNGWKMPAALFGLMSLVVVFAMIRERGGAKAGSVLVDGQGIRLRGRTIGWSQVDKVLLRFGTLTIELRGNKIIQQNIARNEVDAKALETFAQQMIETGKTTAVVNDW